MGKSSKKSAEIGVFLRPHQSLVGPDAFGVGIPEAAAAGFRIGDIVAPPRGKRGKKAIELQRAELRKHKMRLGTVFVGFQGESYESLQAALLKNGIVNPRTRAARLDDFYDAAKFAKAIGAKRVGLHPGHVTHANVREIAAVLEAIIKRLKGLGLSLVIETGPIELETLRTLWYFTPSSRLLYFNFDPGNVVLYRLSTEPVFYLMAVCYFVAHRKILFHAKDAVWGQCVDDPWFGGKDIRIGKGEVPFDEILDWFDGDPYRRPPIIIEHEPATKEGKKRQVEIVTQGRSYLEGLPNF